MARGGFRPSARWRSEVPDDLVVLADQREARAHIRGTVEFQDWREDRKAHTIAILERLALSMDWDDGTITGVTRAELAEHAQVHHRTVSRALSWAREAGVLVCVERGVSARFLGLEHGRCPSYVIASPMPAPAPEDEDAVTSDNRQDVTPPGSSVGRNNLQGGNERGDALSRENDWMSWPWRQAPTTPAERNLAAQRVFAHIGLPKKHRRQGVAMLSRWFDAGCCVAGVIFMLNHKPGEPPAAPRGSILFKAKDPLGVIGGRLKHWQDRLDELPPDFRAVSACDQAASRKRAAVLAEADPTPSVQFAPTSSADVRASARAQIKAALARASRR